jgi:proteasome accessory factor C
MTETASDRLLRLLAVLPLLADEKCVSLDELRRRVGVDPATLLDDLQAITLRADDPGGFIEPVGVEWERDQVSVRTSHFRRPTRITIAELCALELGLAMLGAGTPPDDRAPIDRARARLREAIVNMPAPDEAELWQTAAPLSGKSEIVSQLRTAAAERTKATIAYRGANDTEAVERVIHPYGLVPSHGTWYVVAHCEHSTGLRFFRADRIERVASLTEAYVYPEGLVIDDLVRNGKPFHGDRSEKLIVRYSPRIARWVAEREGVEPADDGSLVVEHPLADVQWGVRHALQYGPDAEVLSPQSVRDEVRRVLTTIAETAT